MVTVKANYITVSAKSFKRYILIIAMLFYGIVAVYSSGYHQEDEHYQIVGFAEYKVGNTREVSWEYKQRIRSTIQPAICMASFYLLKTFSINDPFFEALFLRFITVVLSISVIAFFTNVCYPDIDKKYQSVYLVASFFLWFLPYVNVRFSSESWSGLFFLLTLALVKYSLLTKKSVGFVLTGAVAGFSILFRFQASILVLGLLTWCWFVGQVKYRRFILIIASLITILILGCVIDSWFYNRPTLSFYNYIEINVFRDAASFFGRLPWYYILIYIIKGPTFPIGMLLFGSLFLISVKDVRNVYTWCILPFLLVHCLTPHKELRFLFPLANLCPIVIFKAIQVSEQLFKIMNGLFLKLIFSLMLIINLIGLIINGIKSTRRGEAEIASYVYHQFPGQKVNLITSRDSNPYDPQMGFKKHFYKRENTTITEIISIWTPGLNSHIKKDTINLLVLSQSEYTGALTQKRLEEYGMVLVKNTLPDVYGFFTDLYDDTINDDHLLLYRCMNSDL